LNIAWFDIDFPFFFFFFFLFFVYASVLLCVCVKVILFFPSTWLLSIRKRMNGIVFFFFFILFFLGSSCVSERLAFFLGSYLKAGDWWGSSLRRIRATLCSTKKKIRLFGCCFVFGAFFSVGCCPRVASYNTLRFSTREFPRTANMKRKNFSRRQLFSFFVCVLISNIRILCIIGYLSKSFIFIWSAQQQQQQG
jgi:hypothetical protein